jgi:hypothetical protein
MKVKDLKRVLDTFDNEKEMVIDAVLTNPQIGPNNTLVFREFGSVVIMGVVSNESNNSGLKNN